MTSAPRQGIGSPVTRHPSRLPHAALLAATLALNACASPAYYWQAAQGHLHLMNQREGVADLIAEPSTGDALRAQLELAMEILQFAERELGLPAGGSYRSLVQVGGPVTWNVVATPEFSLEARRWCFPVAGCVAYRGYFDREDAERFAARLRRRGLDVAVTPAAAYSTLGWFDDPLLDTMLSQGQARLAGTLFHELAHQQLYVKSDTEFSEAYASFVEAAGVRLWLERRAGMEAERARWERLREARKDFSRLLQEARERLNQLYRSPVPADDMRRAKQRLFDELRERYAAEVAGPWAGRDYFGAWMAGAPNNASLVTFSAYTGGQCAFAGLLADAGGDLARFHALARAASGQEMTQRKEWLDQPCPGVASVPEL